MKIAICDDDRKDRMDLREALEVVWPDAEVDEYSAGEICLVKLRGGSLRSDFLDIYMEETDGLEIGGEIRRRFPETELVFVSVSREFGPEAIDLDAAVLSCETVPEGPAV